jgi:hypothetical protein
LSWCRDTSGATDWESWTLNGAIYLAVANDCNGITYNLHQHIYRHSAQSGLFELVQVVDTSGARDWESFGLDGGTYVAVANQYDGSTHNVKSRIYRHSAQSGLFEIVEEVDTSGAEDTGRPLHWTAPLANNHYDGSTDNLKSCIYRHSAQSGLFGGDPDTNGLDWEALTLLLLGLVHFDGITHNIKSQICRLGA